ncbi:protein-methionine-sulfoxide reductase catalytic subunit MsrP [Tumidithrix elongata RA019]|uniref:Protein-methionine-sulfoxide reductase catalytic subunit MsrP n=1 Tax=Tumidithrix elongata BACA0141 TaxID=2716417 RepID=A0AAW9PZ65_9CYAN|nr:protein-methionine-sulfoxide reductase catalytic subunit MsrP [Tumidithrix elongata RA019]
MTFFHIPKLWQLPESSVTPEHVFLKRRRFLQTLLGVGLASASLTELGCQSQSNAKDPFAGIKPLTSRPNRAFTVSDRPLTNERLAATYNNFYEFGGSKSTWQNAQALPIDNWKVNVTGLVKQPRTYDLDDLLKRFPLEERIYRFRCVEAWAMVVPWLGFPMNALLREVEPTASAKFVRFTSYFDPQVTPGPSFPPARFLPFPYFEGLRIEEMANDLAFFAVGIYGHTLPKQHGAPIRAVLPWKYGFKGAKSIVKIEFVAQQPDTFWNTIRPGEYKFEANVDPKVSHPRWTQERERLIANGADFNWVEIPTLKYNGYESYIAHLY